MGEKGAYILYPVHRVDQCGREGGIYTIPLPHGESVWKKRGHIYCTSSTGRIRVGEKGTYILFLFHGVDQCGREGGTYTAPLPWGESVWKGGWKECRSQRWWLTTKKHSYGYSREKAHLKSQWL